MARSAWPTSCTGPGGVSSCSTAPRDRSIARTGALVPLASRLAVDYLRLFCGQLFADEGRFLIVEAKPNSPRLAAGRPPPAVASKVGRCGYARRARRPERMDRRREHPVRLDAVRRHLSFARRRRADDRRRAGRRSRGRSRALGVALPAGRRGPDAAAALRPTMAIRLSLPVESLRRCVSRSRSTTRACWSGGRSRSARHAPDRLSYGDPGKSPATGYIDPVLLAEKAT